MYTFQPFPAFLTVVLLASMGCQNLNTRTSTVDELFSDRKVRELARAAESGDVVTIDRLVAEGVDVNAQGWGRVTPLLRSLVAKNKEGFLALLRHGADPNLQDHWGIAAINESADYIDNFWLKKSLEAGGNPNLVSTGLPFAPNKTPIFFAIHKELSSNVDILIQAGADINHQDQYGKTPLHVASELAAYDIVYMLLEAGADYRIEQMHGYNVYDFHYRGRDSGTIEAMRLGEQKVWYYKVVDFLKSDPLNNLEDQSSSDLDEKERRESPASEDK